VLTHHREERVGFQLGFDDTQAELKLRLTIVTAHELVHMESMKGSSPLGGEPIVAVDVLRLRTKGP